MYNMNQEQFSVILRNIHDGVIITDKDLLVTYVNPSTVRISEWESSFPLQKKAPLVFTLLEAETLSNLLQNLPGGSEPCVFHDAIYKTGGATKIVDGSISRISENNGDTAGYVIILRDISEMIKLSANLDYQASHDPLTGFVNREGFAMMLDMLLDEVKQKGGEGSLIQINIDHFNKISKEIGDAGGHSILLQFAEILKPFIQHKKIPARLGSDIFALTLLDSNAENGALFAERINDAIKNTAFIYNDKKFSLTVSMGIVQINKKAPFAEALLSAADKACNTARQAGGNNIVSL
jgi:diguanylate cyclase (GGDEF)-like protein/PAS domain S-box-containing protein